MAALALKRRTPSLGTLPSVPNISVIDTPLPSASITNKPAVLGCSLYHTCRSVLDKLAAVEGMAEYLDLVEFSPTTTSSPTSSSSSSSSSEPSTPNSNSDPLSKLWTLCRRGSPLCTLFNALNPEIPLKVDYKPNLNQVNTCKASVYHFIVGCRDQLKFSEDELFTISDLYQDDTNGFVKVVNTVDKVLQLLEKNGVITVRSSDRNSDPTTTKDTRDMVVQELLETERKYVQDLEILQNYMRELQSQKILSADTIHYLFGNLNTLVDFQRRFLIQLENMAENPPEEQRFCLLFTQMEDAFSVYEPYCANYYSAQDLVVQETPKLQKLADILNPTYELPSMLIKPVQRICKYPLLLSQLIKTTNKDWPHYDEMYAGLEAIKRVTEKVNETQRRYENLQAVEDLKRRMDESQCDVIDGYGSLLLQNKLAMLSGDNERELNIFLFEKALLICKESKDASKNRLTKSNTLSIKKKRRASLQLKGKIYTSRIIGVYNKSQPGAWALDVEFRDREIERFTLKFRNEEQLKLWETTLLKIKATHKSHVPNTHLWSMSAPMTPTGSQNHMTSYFDDEEDDEEDEDEDDDEEEYHQSSSSSSSSRTRSNSLSVQQMLRPKMSRNDSQDASAWKQRAGYGMYPASPPPSSPSSPAASSRASTSSAASTWQRRNDDNSSSPLADIASKFMTAGTPVAAEEDRPVLLPTSRSQSHAAVYPVPTTSSSQHTRVRSQSSPNIRKNAAPQQWEELPQVPINSRTLYTNNDQQRPPPLPRLSDNHATQIDRVISAVPNSPGSVKIKLSYNDDIYAIVVPQEVSFADLMERVENKIRRVANLRPNEVLRLKYQDEDGDLITINSDDDVQMAFENRGNAALNLFITV